MIIVKKGCLFLAEEDQEYEISKNQMFILLPDKHHYSWKPCQEDTGFYWLHFYTTSEWKQSETASIFVSKLPIPELHFHQCSYTLHLPKYANVKEPELIFELFQNIQDSTVPKSGNDIWKTEELFLRFLKTIENAGMHKDRLTLLAEQIQVYLENNLERPITNQILEQQFHLHRNYLAKAMKETFGKTPLEVLVEIRLEYARQYLLRTDYDIRKISRLIGFGSEIYFSNCFKKHMGISPKNYRKKYEKNSLI